MTLDRLSRGQRAIISAVSGEGRGRLRLLEMGLVPGTVIVMGRCAPFGDPVEIELRGYSLTLRRSDARTVETEV